MLSQPVPDEIDTPSFIATASGARELPSAISGDAREALIGRASRNQVFVAAAEPIGVAEQVIASSDTLHGVLLDESDGRPVTGLWSAGLSGRIEAQSLVEGGERIEAATTSTSALGNAEPGELLDDEGLVLSATKRALFRFGGMQGWRLNDSAWIYDLADQTWTQVPLTSADRPAHVLASTYRRNDASVYEVDRGPLGFVAHLRRWIPGSGEFQTLAQWPSFWASFDHQWLLTSDLGDLFYVVSRQRMSVIAHFTFRPDGSLQFAGLQRIRDEIIARPIASGTDVAFTVRAPGELWNGGGIVQHSTPMRAFASAPRTWCPSMKASAAL